MNGPTWMAIAIAALTVLNGLTGTLLRSAATKLDRAMDAIIALTTEAAAEKVRLDAQEKETARIDEEVRSIRQRLHDAGERENTEGATREMMRMLAAELEAARLARRTA